MRAKRGIERKKSERNVLFYVCVFDKIHIKYVWCMYVLILLKNLRKHTNGITR